MPQEPHNNLLVRAAREVLLPLGVHQQGRSRTWLDDHGWWIGVVEFQPSSWARGSYLNVGVTWPWHPDDEPDLFFDVGYRAAGFVEYESDEQYWPEAFRLAATAREKICEFRQLLATMGDARRVLEAQAATERGASWAAWDTAVALALTGHPHAAAEWFAKVAASTDDADFWLPVKARARRWSALAIDAPDRLVGEITALIANNRAALKLPPDHPDLADF